MAIKIDGAEPTPDSIVRALNDLQSQVIAGASTASAAETIPGVGDDSTNNAPSLQAAVGPGGTIVTAGFTRARYPKRGFYQVGNLVDVHPSVSLPMDARGDVIVKPQNNLPATTPQGSQAAVLRIIRDAPAPNYALAYAPTFSGFNLDFRGSTQVNAVHGYRVPNPNPANNSQDPDPNYSTNKDYVAGSLAYSDIYGASGSGFIIEAGNGRFDVFSARALSCSLNGFDLGGNDVVMSGHWAAGGNLQFGVKVGLAAGFFATTGNIWGNSATRSLTCGAMWFNGRKLFGMGFCEFNDWLRMDGNTAFYRGGTIGCNTFAPFAANFVSDGVAIDVTPGTDTRLQANVGITDYQSLNFIGNTHTRTDATSFSTPYNTGGDTTGIYGTAPAYLYDVGNNAMVNFVDQVCSAPNVKPWVNTNPATASFNDPTPYALHGGAQGNYLIQDSYLAQLRVGAKGAVHSKIILGIDETSAGNTAYAIEMGDDTKPSNVQYRNAFYGLCEFSNVVNYTDAAFDKHTFNSPFARTVKAGQVFQRIIVTGTVATGSLTLPTDLTSSHALTLEVTGGTVTAWTWAVSGGGSIDASTCPLPATTTGLLVVEFWYEHDTNAWEVKSVAGQGAWYGRTDNTAAPTGVVGEQMIAKVSSASAVSITSATNTNITSITLTPGDWSVQGSVVFTSTAATTVPTSARVGISTVGATTITTTDATAYANRSVNLAAVASGTDYDSLSVGPTRITVAAGTTQQVWLNARTNYTGAAATATGFGAIRAIRTC